jgi:hypothetical protein
MGGLLAAAGLPPNLFIGVSWAEDNPVAVTAVRQLAEVVDPENRWDISNWGRVAMWNNRPSRTQQQVLGAVQVAAMALRAKTEVSA